MARHKEFEREEVLEKALDVFWCNGYNATSFQILTEGMCINRQSIYDTYGDKHTLFIESLTHYFQKSVVRISAHFDQSLPVRELLKTFFDRIIMEIYDDAQHKGCFLANAALEMVPRDVEVSRLVAKNIEFLYQTFYKTISRGISEGEIEDKKSPETLSLHLINSVHGLRTIGKSMTEPSKLQLIADAALSIV